MSIHRFDHFDLRVSDFAEARKFYDVFLPALGFPKIRAAETEVSYSAEGEHKTTPFIGLNEEPGHRGNANRFAFWADTEEEVNRLGAIIREAGGQNVEGPEYCHSTHRATTPCFLRMPTAISGKSAVATPACAERDLGNECR
ncbi:MAG: VOC family protein [Chthoniobacterales bacterium]